MIPSRRTREKHRVGGGREKTSCSPFRQPYETGTHTHTRIHTSNLSPHDDDHLEATCEKGTVSVHPTSAAANVGKPCNCHHPWLFSCSNLLFVPIGMGELESTPPLLHVFFFSSRTHRSCMRIMTYRQEDAGRPSSRTSHGTHLTTPYRAQVVASFAR